MDWVAIATQLGIPFVCLLALAAGCWKAVVWVGHNIVKPVADRHVRFLDDLGTAITTLVKANQSMVEAQEDMSKIQGSMGTSLERVTEQNVEITANLKEIVEQQKAREGREAERESREKPNRGKPYA